MRPIQLLVGAVAIATVLPLSLAGRKSDEYVFVNLEDDNGGEGSSSGPQFHGGELYRGPHYWQGRFYKGGTDLHSPSRGQSSSSEGPSSFDIDDLSDEDDNDNGDDVESNGAASANDDDIVVVYGGRRRRKMLMRNIMNNVMRGTGVKTMESFQRVTSSFLSIVTRRNPKQAEAINKALINWNNQVKFAVNKAYMRTLAKKGIGSVVARESRQSILDVSEKLYGLFSGIVLGMERQSNGHPQIRIPNYSDFSAPGPRRTTGPSVKFLWSKLLEISNINSPREFSDVERNLASMDGGDRLEMSVHELLDASNFDRTGYVTETEVPPLTRFSVRDNYGAILPTDENDDRRSVAHSSHSRGEQDADGQSFHYSDIDMGDTNRFSEELDTLRSVVMAVIMAPLLIPVFVICYVAILFRVIERMLSENSAANTAPELMVRSPFNTRFDVHLREAMDEFYLNGGNSIS